jgi:hypothetical protein
MTVQLALLPCLIVSGRVEFLSSGRGRRPSAPVEVRLVPDEPLPGTWLGERMAVAGSDGRFTFADVAPGRYRMMASFGGDPNRSREHWTFVAATLLAQAAATNPVELSVGNNVTNSTVVLSDEGAALHGRLERGDGSPANAYTAILFPEERAHWYWRSHLIRAVSLATDGTFQIPALPPARFRLVVVSDIGTDEWFDPAVLGELLPGSLAVELSPGETKALTFRMAE